MALTAMITAACVTTGNEQIASDSTVRSQPVAATSQSSPPVTVASTAGRAHLQGLPADPFGNRVDWVQALRQGKIHPKANVLGNIEQLTVDMDIIMPVKGSMGNVLYSHKAHTEWLTCNNCHPALFNMAKGTSNISMAAIARGESCGVCHGKVAFPVDDCKRCHSQSK
jgi:c(7)-type cytochrome triheme protein